MNDKELKEMLNKKPDKIEVHDSRIEKVLSIIGYVLIGISIIFLFLAMA